MSEIQDDEGSSYKRESSYGKIGWYVTLTASFTEAVRSIILTQISCHGSLTFTVRII